MADLPNKSIAQTYRAARTLAGWSQADLAAKVHLRIATISRFERGGRIRPDNLENITQALIEAGIRFFYIKTVPVGVTYKESSGELSNVVKRNKARARTGRNNGVRERDLRVKNPRRSIPVPKSPGDD